MKIENKKKVKRLDLSKSTLSDEKLNQIISYFPNLVTLNVDNCENLKTLNFLTSTQNLEQICFMNTKISGEEVSKFDLCAKKLKSYKCNNQGIDITKMQDTISRCRYYNGQYSFDVVANGLYDKNLLKELENCKEITYLDLLGYGAPAFDEAIELDLGKCSKLKTVNIQMYPAYCDLIISDHEFDNFRIFLNFSDFTIKGKVNFKRLDLQHPFCNKANFESSFNLNSDDDMTVGVLVTGLCPEISKCSDVFNDLKKVKINEWIFEQHNSSKPQLNSFNKENWSDQLLKISKLGLCNVNINDLKFLENNGNLTELSLEYCNIKDLTGIGNLMNLQKINFSNNSIRNLDEIKNLKKLVTLNLNNNLLEEKFYGDGKEVNNLQILADLNYNNPGKSTDEKGSLRNLYLSNNVIIDFSKILNLTWDEWSGFGGK